MATHDDALFAPIILDGSTMPASDNRKRAEFLFHQEVMKIKMNPKVLPFQKLMLETYKLEFDRGTKRRGVCKYPCKKHGGIIGLSSAMVDKGVSAEKLTKIIRHELSHACNPGQKHNSIWKNFDLMIGGNGERCCTDEEVKSLIGHKIELYCPKLSTETGHFYTKRQNAPSRKWLSDKICPHCKKNGVISYIRWRRV